MSATNGPSTRKMVHTCGLLIAKLIFGAPLASRQHWDALAPGGLIAPHGARADDSVSYPPGVTHSSRCSCTPVFDTPHLLTPPLSIPRPSCSCTTA